MPTPQAVSFTHKTGTPRWLSKLDVLGARYSGAGFKSWCARCEVQTLCSSWKSSGLRIPFQVVHHAAGDGVHGAIDPQPLPAALVFFPLIFTHPVCRSLSARFSPYLSQRKPRAIDSVSLWKEDPPMSSL